VEPQRERQRLAAAGGEHNSSARFQYAAVLGAHDAIERLALGAQGIDADLERGEVGVAEVARQVAKVLHRHRRGAQGLRQVRVARLQAGQRRPLEEARRRRMEHGRGAGERAEQLADAAMVGGGAAAAAPVEKDADTDGGDRHDDGAGER
jgi:hypothetical protein